MRTLQNIGLFIIRLSLITFELFIGFLFVLIIYIIVVSKISAPEVSNVKIGARKQISNTHYTLGNNWLKKNDAGIWEMYIEGDPYERGLIYGELAKELVQKQEEIFVKQIDRFVPSQTWQQFLRLMIGFFNKDLPANIPLENQQEIYGVSASFSDEYNYIASKYSRILNYHAAHDIGHALNDYSMVGCTSFALKNNKTKDGKLLIGRNFDFFVGDEFAKEKLILFLKPTSGYGFVSYSWAGFTGVVSGLNEKGLSVTINASKSDLPTASKTPISILAREILQYAKNIDEAISIAKKRQTFVSETLLIGSKIDGKSILIEKSPTKTGVLAVDTDEMICSNHYQSDVFIHDEINVENIQKSDSRYRFARVKELLAGKYLLTPNGAAWVLRDQYDINGDTLGMGNPRAVNQLIAHHSVVIQPEIYRYYASTNDFQLGKYIGYDLKKSLAQKKAVIVDTIDEDPFVSSQHYEQFKLYNVLKKRINDFLLFNKEISLSASEINSFIESNGELYITYELLGRYYMKKEMYDKAKIHFEVALSKKVASLAIEEELRELIKQCTK